MCGRASRALASGGPHDPGLSAGACSQREAPALAASPGSSAAGVPLPDSQPRRCCTSAGHRRSQRAARLDRDQISALRLSPNKAIFGGEA